jgi:hypothetical protein
MRGKKAKALRRFAAKVIETMKEQGKEVMERTLMAKEFKPKVREYKGGYKLSYTPVTAYNAQNSVRGVYQSMKRVVMQNHIKTPLSHA